MSSSPKPQPLHKKVGGPEAIIDEKDIGPNEKVSAMIRDAAKLVAPWGTRHAGTLLVNVYEQDSILARPTVFFSTQIIQGSGLSEGVCQVACQQITTHAMRDFGVGKPSTRDPSDKRKKYPSKTYRGNG